MAQMSDNGLRDKISMRWLIFNRYFVQPRYKTTSSNTNHDNFSKEGNVNPYNGQSGYAPRDYSNGAYNYGSGQTIYTGSRGRQYYYNSNGNKTYGLKAQLTQGTVSQEADDHKVLYSIPSLPGSNGSPVIDQWGNLVAINYATVSNSQNFNYGINAKYLKALLNVHTK